MSKRPPKELKNPYFDLQAEMGATKHGGGKRATDELLDLCHVSEDSQVLYVGCGPGKNSCYIARKCQKLMGIDISEAMIRASEREAQRQKVANATFKVADAQKLPFEANTFDAAILESVMAFVPDQKKAMKELKRVVKRGGYVGLNEMTEMEKVPEKTREQFSRLVGGIETWDFDGWKKLLTESGLEPVFTEAREMGILQQMADEMSMFSFKDMPRLTGRMLHLYFTSPPHRRAIHKLARDSKGIGKDLFRYYGYGLYVGRK